MRRLLKVAFCFVVFTPACGDDSDPTPADNTPDASVSTGTEVTSETNATTANTVTESTTLTTTELFTDSTTTVVAEAGVFTISSPHFNAGDPLPDEYTCEGKAFGGGYSPELNWSGAPAGTKSYAIVFKDLTLIDEPRFAYHWAAWNIPASVTGIPEHLDVGQFPTGLEGGEQFRAGPPHDTEFFGPCPAWRHHCFGEERVNDDYSFTLYAFAQEQLSPPAPVADVNYAFTLSTHFEAVALAVTEINATSNASPSSAPMCPEQTDAGDGGPNSASDSSDRTAPSDAGRSTGDAGLSDADASLDAG